MRGSMSGRVAPDSASAVGRTAPREAPRADGKSETRSMFRDHGEGESFDVRLGSGDAGTSSRERELRLRFQTRILLEATLMATHGRARPAVVASQKAPR